MPGPLPAGFIGDGSLPIANIQRYLAEQANKNGWSKLRVPEKATGKKIAVVGAGPAGLACAAKLLEAGHAVTVFDKSTAFGGAVESVIPPDRQRSALKNEITAMFADVPKDRMILNLGTELNSGHNLDTILAQGFDAAFIGLGLPKSTSITEKPLDGLWNAMDFLSAAKQGNGAEAHRQVRRRDRRRQHGDGRCRHGSTTWGPRCLCDLPAVVQGDARLECRADPSHDRRRPLPRS